MTMESLYERVRTKLNEGHQNPFSQLLKNRSGIRGPIEGTSDAFSQIVYELTRGRLNLICEKVSCAAAAKGTKDLLKFPDGSLFSVVRTRGGIAGQTLIVVTPYTPQKGDPLTFPAMPLAHLVYDRLGIRDAFKRVANEYAREERNFEAEKASEERRMARESTPETALKTIENAGSGETIMIRGLPNIGALVQRGFVPSLVDNPDNWVDAEDFPGLRYRHAKSGVEILLTGRERLRPIEDLSRIELYFYVNRSDDDPALFALMRKKFRETTRDGSPYSLKEFHDDLIALAKYPEELKDRTEADLGIMADEVEHVIDRRRELDKGILPYEAVIKRDTQGIVDHVVTNRIPTAEIRKALDFCEYTGVIDALYKGELSRRIAQVIAMDAAVAKSTVDLLYDKRVKEIVAIVLKKIPRDQLTEKTITLAMAPYVNELGFGKLIKIRERILQLKELVHTRIQ